MIFPMHPEALSASLCKRADYSQLCIRTPPHPLRKVTRHGPDEGRTGQGGSRASGGGAGARYTNRQARKHGSATCGERLAAGSMDAQPPPPGYGLSVRYAIVLAEASVHFGLGSLFGVTIALLEAPY